MKDVAKQLKTTGHFDALSDTELDVLVQALSVLDLSDGQRLFEEGDPGDSLHVILSGEVRVTQDRGDGSEPVHLGRMEAGELIGLVSLIDRGPRSATCTAVGATRVGVLNQAAFTLMHEGSPELVLHFQLLVARQLARDSRSLNDVLVRAMLAPSRETSSGPSLSNDLKLS